MTQATIVESNQKLDELARALNEADSTKKKLNVENQDLNRQIEETENGIAALQKNKISLTTQLEDTKRLADGEARDRATLLTKYKNLHTEAENLKMKIDEEAEEQISALNTKIASNEKSKHRLQAELEEMSLEYERTHAAAVITEKRGHNFEKVVGEWKTKADDMQCELEASHSECRNLNAEGFRLKAGLDEANEQLDIVRRENKNLADEIKDLLDQLGDG